MLAARVALTARLARRSRITVIAKEYSVEITRFEGSGRIVVGGRGRGESSQERDHFATPA